GVYADGQKPLSLADTLAWKRTTNTQLSHNGEWLVYKLSPAEGNAEVVVRNLKTGKEQRFPVGDAGAAPPAGGGGAAAAGGVAVSADSRWAVFSAYPTTEQAKRLKKDRRPVQSRAVLVELATNKKTEFEKIRRFALSGENAGWLALQRYGADAPGGGAAPAAGAAAAAPGAAAADRPTGTDLLFFKQKTAYEMNLGNVADFTFNKKGEYLA